MPIFPHLEKMSFNYIFYSILFCFIVFCVIDKIRYNRRRLARRRILRLRRCRAFRRAYHRYYRRHGKRIRRLVRSFPSPSPSPPPHSPPPSPTTGPSTFQLSHQETNLQTQRFKKQMKGLSGEVLTAQEHAKHGAVEAARLVEELNSDMTEWQRKRLEMQVKEMQIKIEKAEMTALKTGPKLAAKLEGKLKAVENELEVEQRRSLAKAERRARELQFMAEEERKTYEKLCDLAEKLQVKIQSQKKLLDDTEEQA